MRTTLEAGGVLQLDQEIPTLAAFMEEYWRVYALPNLSPNTRDVCHPRGAAAPTHAGAGPPRGAGSPGSLSSRCADRAPSSP